MSCNKQKVLLIFMMSIYFCHISSAASFNCKKAGTWGEKAICTDPELSVLDDQLANVYKLALGRATDPQTLKVQQRKWLSIRNQCSENFCLKRLYQSQIDLLANRNDKHIKRVLSPAGEYERGDSASIKITALANDEYYVTGTAFWVLNAEMGNIHIGEIEGTFPLKDNVLFYDDTNGGEYGCKLKIIFFTTKLVVTDDNMQCGGVNVSFNGSYKKVSNSQRELPH